MECHIRSNSRLKELRRLRIKFNRQGNDTNNTVTYVDRYQEFRLNITYEIDTNGAICYKLNNQVIIKDTGKKLEVIQDTNDNIKLTLDLAMAKFGKNINLTGTNEFKQKTVEMAVKNNYKVEFLDEYSKQYYVAYLNQVKNNITENSNEDFSRLS